jgi:diguanylate cyclase (GGDEF)-like protein/PAS domain S-box-containing protein
MGTRRDEPFGEAARAWQQPLPGDAPYRALVDGVTDYAIMLMDAQGVIQSWNAGAALIHGYTADQAVGQNFSMLYTAAEAARGYPARTLDTARKLGRTEEQGWRVRADGMRFWARVVINALRDEDGTVYGFGQIVRDLTQERRREDALRLSEERTHVLREQAMRDPLTGAFNRRYLLDYLRSSVDRSGTVAASLLAVDLDHFKEVNDQAGHDVGDAVLVAVARLAQKLSRDADRLFRVGGDEFLMYLPGVDREAAAAIGDRLREAVQRARIPEQRPVTVSIGVAQLRPEDSVETWIQNADGAMYAAKRDGRNRVA